MKKIYFLFTGIIFLSFCEIKVNAQCTGIHYRDFMYQDSTVSNIKYGYNTRYNGQTDSLKLDIHFPKADPTPLRPLILWAHGGNFLSGDKTGTDVLPLSQDFAKCGYVVASINYRVGMEGVPFPGPDSAGATRSVMRAVHDAKAAVRFFRKSFANGNPYRIDTSKIFFGGVSAGAFMALHLAYIDNMSQYPTWCDTTKPGMGGGLEGRSGNPGYRSNVKAIINICGAIGDTSWIQPGDEPVLSFHGDNDQVVPYGTARIIFLGSYPLQIVHGSKSITKRANRMGVINCFHTFVGQGHVPEVGNAAFYDTTRTITRNFLVTFVCGDALNCNYVNPLSVTELDQKNMNIHCYPNPAGSMLTIDLNELNGEEAELSLFNAMGQEVRNYKGIRNSQVIIERGDLNAGLYLVNVLVKGKHSVARIIFD